MGQPAPEVFVSSNEGIPQSLDTAAGSGAVVIPDEWLGKVIGLNCSGKNGFDGKSYSVSSEHTFNVTGWQPILQEALVL